MNATFFLYLQRILLFNFMTYQKELVFQNKYITVYYQAQQRILEVTWTDDGTMNEESYKEAMLAILQTNNQYQPLYSLADTRQFLYSISPEVQTWINENIFTNSENRIIQKYAFVVPTNIFSLVSIQQTMEEGDREEKTKYFKSTEEALQWLLD
ncbi:MAG: hypothetical protein EAZ55_06555 [Cytophagales bacterium]|nr:MAG: hypothetical protein EAZ55_06555 [Cytophagales bacterium]